MHTKSFGKLALSLVGFASTSFPALALACPGYASNASACGAHAGGCGGGYLSAIGLGLAIGIGSSALEGIFHKKR